MDKSLGSPADPTVAGALLAETERVRREARRDRHSFWLPLTLFGLIVLGALPLYYEPTSTGMPTPLPDGEFSADLLTATEPDGVTILGGALNSNSDAIGRYWLIALPLGYLATAVYYWLRARRRGVGGRSWPFALTGVGLLVALVLSAIPLLVPMLPLMPLLSVGIGVFVLAALERSRSLIVIAAAFFGLAVAVNLYNFENVAYQLGIDLPDGTSGLVNVAMAGLVLLGCGLAVARGQLRRS